jgi:hypothetical protein
MTLREKQSLFAYRVGLLLLKVVELGYECTLGDAYRDPRLHGEVGEKKGYGHSKSCHKVRLAIDLNLFKDGKYITNEVGHEELGKWWKDGHPLARWGGDFRIKDFNHYSFEHEGMQ